MRGLSAARPGTAAIVQRSGRHQWGRPGCRGGRWVAQPPWRAAVQHVCPGASGQKRLIQRGSLLLLPLRCFPQASQIAGPRCWMVLLGLPSGPCCQQWHVCCEWQAKGSRLGSCKRRHGRAGWVSCQSRISLRSRQQPRACLLLQVTRMVRPRVGPARGQPCQHVMPAQQTAGT